MIEVLSYSGCLFNIKILNKKAADINGHSDVLAVFASLQYPWEDYMIDFTNWWPLLLRKLFQGIPISNCCQSENFKPIPSLLRNLKEFISRK